LGAPKAAHLEYQMVEIEQFLVVSQEGIVG
jgi:hypothetical protein